MTRLRQSVPTEGVAAAKLAYLTQPAPGVYLFNLKIEGGPFQRVEITKAQLGNIIVDGAAMALREPA